MADYFYITPPQQSKCPLYLAKQAVDNLQMLVHALENTHWSSWQSTASFNKELEEAKNTLKEIEAATK
jgi:hypothetical protein